MDTSRLIDDLTRVGAYPREPERVEVLQTHVSVLFFAGDRVYKVKKAVDLGFVDSTTLERRLRLCEEEVRLNRRLASGVHLGVVPITEDAGGRLRIGGGGEAVEWAVEMVRLPRERMLDAMLERGEIDNARLGELSALVARFHAEAATGEGVDEHGSPEAVGGNALENFEQVRPFVAERGGALTSLQHRFLEQRTRRFLAEHRGLLERRVAEGRIRDGHGDLHAENVCFLGDRIAIYDRIEFAPRLRCCDVANDVAFLSMDLDFRGFHGFAGYLLRRYAEDSGDGGVLELAPFYAAYRAMVRAKVSALATADSAIEEERRAELLRRAMRYVQLAACDELSPALVLLCGLPATGKSSIARGISDPLRAPVLRSDVRRRSAAGLRPGERAAAAYGEGLYTPERRAAVYEDLRESAEAALAKGHSVVVDASFERRAWREPFARAAERAGATLALLWVEAPDAVVRARLERRPRDPLEPSDAGPEVYERAREAFEPPDDPGERRALGGVLVRVSGEGAAEEAGSLLLDARIRDAEPAPRSTGSRASGGKP